MNKIGLFAAIALAAGLIVSCGGTKPQPQPQPQPKADDSPAKIQIYVLQKSEDPTPPWINKRWELGKDETGRKVMYLTVEGEKNTKEKARIDAESQKIARLSELIKQVATREFAVAKSGMLNDETDLDSYFEETIAAVSKNVNISGAVNVADYYEYIQEVQGDNSKTYYRYVMRFAMDYDTYQKALTQAWEPQKKKIPPELKDKAEKVLDSINKSEDLPADQ
ncbi:MAG: hypothetical protein ABSG94_10745 [Brevinematales bacterium]|jgi:hypothetical protein